MPESDEVPGEDVQGRCCAVVGTVWTRHNLCGNPAKSRDVNGRPVCGVHKKGQPGIEWRGHGHRYPYGDGEGAIFKGGDIGRTRQEPS